MLDERQYRSDQPATSTNSQRDPSGCCPDDLNLAHTTLGAGQRDWLLEELADGKIAPRGLVLEDARRMSAYERVRIDAPPAAVVAALREALRARGM